MPSTPRIRPSPFAPATPANSAGPSGLDGLPPHRVASIGELTARARALHAELVENSAKTDVLQYRNAAIRRELAEIETKVREHAWDGQPLA